MKKIAFIALFTISLIIMVSCADNNNIATFADFALQADMTAPSQGSLTIIDSYSDGESNYYLLDAGEIKDIYISTLAQVDYTGIPISFSKTTDSSTTITESLGAIVAEGYSLSTTTGKKYNLSAELNLAKIISVKGALEWSFSNTAAQTISKSTQSTFTTVKSYGESQTISYSFGENTHAKGKYRYAIYGVVDVYYVISTSLDNLSLQSWQISVCAKPNEYFVRSEYSKDGRYNNEPKNNITFQENFYKTLPLPSKSGPDNVIAETKYIHTYPLSCKLDNKYNYTQIDPNADDIHFSHQFEFGKFVVSGGQFRSGNVFGIVPNDSINIDFRLEYDADNLPIQDNMKSRCVSNDSKQSGFYDLPWNVGERQVGRGMIVALVSYNDGTPSDKICITDAFNNKKAGEKISIVKDLKKPCEIEIAICYELEMWAPGFLDIVDNYWMNWRINQGFQVVN